MRTTRALREKLETRAARSGRSLAQEVEHRLEGSFDAERAAAERWRSAQTAILLNAIGTVLVQVEHFIGNHWWDDSYTCRQVREAVDTLISGFVPSGTQDRPHRGQLAELLSDEQLAQMWRQAFEEGLGRFFARGYLRTIRKNLGFSQNLEKTETSGEESQKHNPVESYQINEDEIEEHQRIHINRW